MNVVKGWEEIYEILLRKVVSDPKFILNGSYSEKKPKWLASHLLILILCFLYFSPIYITDIYPQYGSLDD